MRSVRLRWALPHLVTLRASGQRTVESLVPAVGIVIGIALGEALLLTVGQGLWQLALVPMVTPAVARTLSPSNAVAVAAGVQSILVMLLPVPAGGPLVRSIDGIIGGAIALIVTALVPRDPRRIACRDARLSPFLWRRRPDLLARREWCAAWIWPPVIFG